MDRYSLIFTPFLPWPVIGLIGAAALAVAGMAILARQRGAWLRLLALALLVLALANPAFLSLDRDKLNDVVAVVLDRSGSQRLGDRAAQTDRTRDEVLRQLNARPGTDVRVIEVDERDGEADGTRLFEGLQAGLADVPPERMAGVIAITDGRVHDIPAAPRRWASRRPSTRWSRAASRSATAGSKWCRARASASSAARFRWRCASSTQASRPRPRT